MSNTRSHKSSLNLKLSNEEILKSSAFSSNVGQGFILTTVDKVESSLIKHRDAIKLRRDWIAPSGMAISFLAALVTADFKGFLGFSSDTVKAFFIFAFISSSIWLFVALYHAVHYLIKYRGKKDIDLVVNDLKGDATINNEQREGN